jgi:hypothetical protein
LTRDTYRSGGSEIYEADKAVLSSDVDPVVGSPSSLLNAVRAKHGKDAEAKKDAVVFTEFKPGPPRGRKPSLAPPVQRRHYTNPGPTVDDPDPAVENQTGLQSDAANPTGSTAAIFKRKPKKDRANFASTPTRADFLDGGHAKALKFMSCPGRVEDDPME